MELGKVCLCFSLLIVAASAASNKTAQELRDEAWSYMVNCAKQHHVGRQQFKYMQSAVKLTVMNPSENVRCFARCVIYDSGFYHDGAFDLERVLEVTNAQGKPEKFVRKIFYRCRELVEGEPDCYNLWEVYRCFHGSV